MGARRGKGELDSRLQPLHPNTHKSIWSSTLRMPMAVGEGGGADKARLAKIPSTKFQSSDGHIFHVVRDIAKGYVTIKIEEEDKEND